MERKYMNLVVLPEEEWNQLRIAQNEILELLKNIRFEPRKSTHPYGYMTAIEFMETVRIRRTKFDQLVHKNRIRAIKNLHKVYVPVSEVERYFKDNTIP